MFAPFLANLLAHARVLPNNSYFFKPRVFCMFSGFVHIVSVLFQLISTIAPILGLAHAYLLLSLQLGRLRSLHLAQNPPRHPTTLI
jgi:hypothetical protein